MTVFEDLLEELKDENLLENTVIDLKRADAAPGSVDEDDTGFASGFNRNFAAENFVQSSSDEDDGPSGIDLPQIEEPSDERDFFRKRAVDEVSSLQMVEHVLSAVEREHMKMTPVSFDDLEAKKALHKFLQVSGDVKSPEHAKSEFGLRQETEAWSFALLERDQKISAANIRRFCEESRPALSSAALISLARFYRNSPYSEDVRGKFDFVMTRLFSRDTEDETRQLLFPRPEMVGHITTLYANWSSIAMYTQSEDAVEVSLTVTRFDEFGIEIENTETFDELLEIDFFNKVRIYKQESAEMFYVPGVTAAAIECNIRIGNKYVELIAKERTARDSRTIQKKYGFTYDQIVSNAAGKTLLLVDLLKLGPDGEVHDFASIQAFRNDPQSAAPAKRRSEARTGVFGINKWLMIVAVISILVSGGFYLWVEKFAGEEALTTVAKTMEIDDPDVKQHLRSLRASNETLYAITEPTFDTLGEPQQREFLQKVLKLANERNLRKVNLLNNKGRTIAYATQERVELTAAQ
ncbi:MAG: hypothetical protein ABIU09_12740 [Pyrinomonadaceae bacterium]